MIQPGQTIGIVGGGQLARMSAFAARAMGYRVVIADPDVDCPAAAAADRVITAKLSDPNGVFPLAEASDVITYEFENIDPAVLQRLAESRPVYPGVEILAMTQNRVLEKTGLEAIGVAVAPWHAVQTEADLDLAIASLGLPAVLKTVTEGYDGKGQAVLRSPSDVAEGFARLRGRPLILEGWVEFVCEISVVVARSIQGEIRSFPVAENIHRHNILALSIVPARIAESAAEQAAAIAHRIAERLNLVGLLGVEMFLLSDGRVLVNELAPRPHNSGHFSMDACVTSQFEQHVRSVCGLPLGSTALLSPVVMQNIMGEDYPLDLPALLDDPNIKLHLYGKREPRPHRKMGHFNALGSSVPEALERAEAGLRKLRSAHTKI
jgi:5-(carboxyamino)imidazole ribonucleotide synthase